MDKAITANDLWPLVQKLPHDEQVRLAKLALRAAAQGTSDGPAYRAAPPRADEFSQEDDGLAWEAEGWDEFDA